MKKIYTLSMAMMLASLPALAQKQTMTLHAPVAVQQTQINSLKSVNRLDADNQDTRKLAARAGETPSMPLGYSGSAYYVYAVGCGETGVGIKFPASYLEEFVGSQITAVNVAAPYNAKYSTQTNYVNKCNTCKVMICNEMNGTPVTEQQGRIGTKTFEYNTVTLSEPYTIEAGKDVFVYVQYEGVTEDDYIIVMDSNQATTQDAGYLYSKFKDVVNNEVVLQEESEWKPFVQFLGYNFCITATVTGDNLPKNKGYVIADATPISVTPGTPFEYLIAVVNQGVNNLSDVDLAVKIGNQDVQTKHVTLVNLSDQTSSTIGFNEMGLGQLQLTCDTEGVIPYTVTVAKVNGVDNPMADIEYSGSITSLENGYPYNVVIEELTSTKCGYCPIGIVGMEQMREKYGNSGRVIPIAVHSPIPTAGDPLDVCSNQNDPYSDFCSVVGGAPASVIMRQMGNIISPTPDNLENEVQTWFAAQSPLELTATITPTDNEKSVKLNTVATAAIDMAGNYGISYTIVEDNLGPYRQTNYYSGGQYGTCYGWEQKANQVQTIYNDVARKGSVFYPISASIVSNLEKGKDYSYTANVNLNYVSDMTKYSIAAMLVNCDTNEIVNACIVRGPGFTGIEGVETDNASRIANGLCGAIEMFSTGDIYSVDGRAMAIGVNGTVELPAGLYIVTTPAGNAKVMVR